MKKPVLIGSVLGAVVLALCLTACGASKDAPRLESQGNGPWMSLGHGGPGDVPPPVATPPSR